MPVCQASGGDCREDTADGTKALCVVIENDGLDETEEQAAQDYSRLSPSQIAGLIREAELSDWRAGFPHVKTEPRKPVDTVLINGLSVSRI